MERVTIQDALDYCLVNPDGLSVEELLTKFPEYRAELQPLLALTADIVSLTPPPVPLERREAMKQRLMKAASAAAPTIALAPPVSVAPAPRPWWEGLAALVRRPAFAGAFGALAVVALLWWSAAGSLPDSPLYGLKLTGEDAMRNFTGGTSGRIESHLGSAVARLNEIKEMQRRGELAQAGPAIESYRSNIANGAALWEQTSGDERTNLAKRLYISSAQGFLGLQAVAPDMSNVAERVRANITETITVLEDVRVATVETLVSAAVDVHALLLEADIEPSSLPNIAARTPTIAVAVIAGTTQTSLAATRATETARSSAPATETSAPRATETVAANPTATTGVGQTAIPTATRAAPSATPTVQPPTARPATNTPRPAQPTATRRATNTRILPRPTDIPIVVTSVLRTVVPTITQAPIPTRPPITSTPAPTIEPTLSATPIPILTQVPPLPTVTVEVPPLPTLVPNTPVPTSTPVVPLPTITGLPITPLPTVSLPTPPLPILTPQPLPTEILCPLELVEVDISCGQELCLAAEGQVHNSSSVGVQATWTAELRVRVGTGSYITLSTQTGNEEFAPGDTPLEPSFCVALPVGTTLVQIRLSLNYAGCSDQQSSSAMPPCLLR